MEYDGVLGETLAIYLHEWTGSTGDSARCGHVPRVEA
jgi:hypothetical protein